MQRFSRKQKPGGKFCKHEVKIPCKHIEIVKVRDSRNQNVQFQNLLSISTCWFCKANSSMLIDNYGSPWSEPCCHTSTPVRLMAVLLKDVTFDVNNAQFKHLTYSFWSKWMRYLSCKMISIDFLLRSMFLMRKSWDGTIIINNSKITNIISHPPYWRSQSCVPVCVWRHIFLEPLFMLQQMGVGGKTELQFFYAKIGNPIYK